jgi:hypothetical protein
MDPTLLSLLDSIPQKSPRSKLETHRELIRQLRRKGCTYRDIVRILRERVGRICIEPDPSKLGRRCLPNCGTQSKTS